MKWKQKRSILLAHVHNLLIYETRERSALDLLPDPLFATKMERLFCTGMSLADWWTKDNVRRFRPILRKRLKNFQKKQSRGRAI